MTSFGELVREISPHCLLALSDQIVAYQSHHYALFLDQTVDDALGGEGWAVRKQAAFEASHALLASVFASAGVDDPREMLGLAADTFAQMGQGRLSFDVRAEGGAAHATDLYCGLSFAEKYGAQQRSRHAVDALAAGYAAAAASLAFPSDWGRFDADESTCVARGEQRCSFVLGRIPERLRFGTVIARATVEATPVTLPTDIIDEELTVVEQAISAVLDALEPNAQGLVRAFDVNLCLMPTSYTSQITFDTMHLIEKRSPELFGVFGSLVREAAQVGAFHLLGGVLASPDFREVVGPVASDPEERLSQLLGIAHALGWGAMHATSFSAGRSMVLRCPATHESIYYALRHGTTVRTRLPFLQGVASALMMLTDAIDFEDEQPIRFERYITLCREGAPIRVEETRSTVRGDSLCEVIAEQGGRVR